MSFAAVKARIRALPEVAAWPQMSALMERVSHRETLSVWDYPVAACEAVGGDAAAALAGSAAVFCSLISIHLVDDLLDEDPRGEHHRLGIGQAANLALAFQAAGHRVLAEAPVDAPNRVSLQECLGGMALATAFGQSLDSQEVESEEEYWRTVEAKTPPLFGSAFRIGGLLGGTAGTTVLDALEEMGRILGRFVQVSDDLADALQTPAQADWARRMNNLPILYAMTAAHPERESFRELSSHSSEPEALAEAQRILVRSGAVSYCLFKMIELRREAQRILDRTPLHDGQPLSRVFELHMKPLHRLLESAGVEEPAILTLA